MLLVIVVKNKIKTLKNTEKLPKHQTKYFWQIETYVAFSRLFSIFSSCDSNPLFWRVFVTWASNLWIFTQFMIRSNNFLSVFVIQITFLRRHWIHDLNIFFQSIPIHDQPAPNGCEEVDWTTSWKLRLAIRKVWVWAQPGSCAMLRFIRPNLCLHAVLKFLLCCKLLEHQNHHVPQVHYLKIE